MNFKKMKWLLSLDGRIWSSSFLNAFAIGSGIYTVFLEKSTSNVSLGMISIFLYMQITYAQSGKRDGNKGQMWGMRASAALTAIFIILKLFVYN